MSMTTFCPSNDSFSAAAMSRLVKHRLHYGPRPLASIPAAAEKEKEKEKKIIVMRSGGGSNNVVSFHYLFRQAQPEFRETLSLPFSDEKGRRICCGECRGLLHFDTRVGDIILCNPTTAQFSIFPRPWPRPREGRRRVRDDVTFFEPSGFGYDHTSDDYKLVRILWHSYFHNEKKKRTYGYKKILAQVYSFKSKSWKVIEYPREARIGPLDYKSCAYVSGKYYWVHGIPSNDRILSFDFATDTLEISPLPKSDDIIHGLYQFVELEEGKLGAILRERPEASRASTRVELWVFKEDGSWVRRFGAALDNVVRSLGLKHGVLFFEGKKSGEKLSQLVVLDLATEKLDWLEVYDNFETMEIFSYSESTYTLPDGSTCLFDDDDDDDDDEIENTSDWETDDDDDDREEDDGCR